MRLETTRLSFVPLNLDQIQIDRRIYDATGAKSFPLTQVQFDFLKELYHGQTVAQIIQEYLARGMVVSFAATYQLLEFLAVEGLATDRFVHDYFRSHFEEPVGLFTDLANRLFGEVERPVRVKQELRALPFFRLLKSSIFELLLSQARVTEVPARTLVCKEGDNDRRLFALMRGEAYVMKRTDDGRRRHLATLTEGAVFGEAGFFAGASRQADVMTTADSIVLAIDYHPEKFHEVLNLANARELQQRVWVTHSLLKSEFFSDVPSECFDALVFSGKMRTFNKDVWLCREGQWGDSCFLMVKGSAVVSRRAKALKRMEQGECFGEVALIMTGGRRSASVHSETDVLALEIHANAFYKLLAENLPLALRFEAIAAERLAQDRKRA